jgi:hypothetical protein
VWSASTIALPQLNHKKKTEKHKAHGLQNKLKETPINQKLQPTSEVQNPQHQKALPAEAQSRDAQASNSECRQQRCFVVVAQISAKQRSSGRTVSLGLTQSPLHYSDCQWIGDHGNHYVGYTIGQLLLTVISC